MSKDCSTLILSSLHFTPSPSLSLSLPFPSFPYPSISLSRSFLLLAFWRDFRSSSWLHIIEFCKQAGEKWLDSRRPVSFGRNAPDSHRRRVRKHLEEVILGHVSRHVNCDPDRGTRLNRCPRLAIIRTGDTFMQIKIAYGYNQENGLLNQGSVWNC